MVVQWEPSFKFFIRTSIFLHHSMREHSGSVVECLTLERGVRASPESLHCVLEQEH